ncbi:flagellar assembly protein FliW [Azovibrio restrictus]|uniref:flagellar assembly protein FliW n=1 Tax=Azovibrio restrictus TaxID=146938 RepID=UPI0026EDF43D|nr:flagellar assembly protein FliW [Azovibrio restrictus]
MKVETFLFGSVEVKPEQIIEFPNGLLSFEDNKRFMLIHESETGEPVSFTLQSLDDPHLALQIMDPAALGFTYELALSDAETSLLKLDDPADAVVVLVLYKQEEVKASAGISANLRAPLIINTKTRLGLQKLLERVRPNVVLSNLSSVAG